MTAAGGITAAVELSVFNASPSPPETSPPAPPAGRSHWIRRAWTQIVLVSFIVTLSRGTLNALNAIGGLGTGDVQTATVVNLLSSISFALLSWSSGGIVNLLGYRMSVSIGSFTTTLTLSMLMLYTTYHCVSQGVVYAAATLDGVGSGVLWTACGTVLIRYPSEARKGFASTVLFAIYSTGAAGGGLLSFFMNLNQNASTTSFGSPYIEDGIPLQPTIVNGLKPASYTLMITLAFISFCLCRFVVPENLVIDKEGNRLLESSPISMPTTHDVTPQRTRLHSRENSRVSSVISSQSAFRLFTQSTPNHPSLVPESITRRKVVPSYCDTTSNQLRQLRATLHERAVQFLLIYSFASLFHQTYLFNGINYRAFNVRTRGLNCFMYWVGRIPAGFLHCHLVDNLRFPTRTRAIHGLCLLLTYVATCQVLAVTFWTAVPAGTYDVAVDPANSVLAFCGFFLYGGLDTVSQSFVLWIFSCLGRRHPRRVPHYVAVFRCFQGLGSSLAWGLDLNSFASYHTQFLVCAFCWLMALPGLTSVISSLPKEEDPTSTKVRVVMLHTAEEPSPS